MGLILESAWPCLAALGSIISKALKFCPKRFPSCPALGTATGLVPTWAFQRGWFIQ